MASRRDDISQHHDKRSAFWQLFSICQICTNGRNL